MTRRDWVRWLSRCVIIVAAAIAARTARAQLSSDQPAAILVFPYVVADSAQGLDTFIELSNSNASLPVRAQCFYEHEDARCSGNNAVCHLQSDCPQSQTCIVDSLATDFAVTFQKQQPLGWKVSKGDTGMCYPAPPGPYVNCATDADCAPFGGTCITSNPIAAVPDPFVGALRCIVLSDVGTAANELLGVATIEHLVVGPTPRLDATRYNAIGIQANPAGAPNTDAVLTLGTSGEYNSCPASLMLEHVFDGATDPMWSASSIATFLALVPCSIDYQHVQPGQATVTYVVENEFHQKITGSAPFTVGAQFNDMLSNIDASAFGVGVQGTLTGQTILSSSQGIVGIALERRTSLADPALSAVAARGIHGRGVLANPDSIVIPDELVAEFATRTPTGTPTITPTPMATPTPTPLPCVGDCNAPIGSVTIDEVQHCVNLFLGTQEVATCTACDRNGNGVVTIDEVQATVNSFLDPDTCPHVLPAQTSVR